MSGGEQAGRARPYGTYDRLDCIAPTFHAARSRFSELPEKCTHIPVRAWVAPQWQPGGGQDCRIGLFGIVRISTGKLALAGSPGDGVDNDCRLRPTRCEELLIPSRAVAILIPKRLAHRRMADLPARARTMRPRTRPRSQLPRKYCPAAGNSRFARSFRVARCRTGRKPSSRLDRAARATRPFMRKQSLDAICALWPASPRHAPGIPPPTLHFRVHPCICRPEHRTD